MTTPEPFTGGQLALFPAPSVPEPLGRRVLWCTLRASSGPGDPRVVDVVSPLLNPPGVGS